MLLECTHHKCVTKRNKYPELSPCVSEVLSSALLGNGSVRIARLCLGQLQTGLWRGRASPRQHPLPFPASSLLPGGTGMGEMLFAAAGRAGNGEVFLCVLGIFLNGMFRQC